MDWANSDEQLYQALTLEQRLSVATNEAAAKYLTSTSYPCAIYEPLTTREKSISYYLKMRRRWYGDPFSPWNLTLLVLWIPTSIVYFCYQSIRSLASARNVWSCTAQDIARIGPHELSFGPSSFDADSVIPYANITKLGYYTNGLRVDQGYKRLLLSAEAAPALFVALRHLTPSARVTSGLIVPTGFIDRCSRNGYNIDVTG
jgi:hypothetical protein